MSQEGFIFNDPLIFEKRTDGSFPILTRRYQVLKQNDYRILLDEIPSKFHGVIIRKVVNGEIINEPYTIITEGVPKSGECHVSYLHGVLTFNAEENSNEFEITWYGVGNFYTPASRVWFEGHPLMVQRTLKDVLDEVYTVIEGIGSPHIILQAPVEKFADIETTYGIVETNPPLYEGWAVKILDDGIYTNRIYRYSKMYNPNETPSTWYEWKWIDRVDLNLNEIDIRITDHNDNDSPHNLTENITLNAEGIKVIDNNENVTFWAKSNGDLQVKGKVQANEGDIGGWIISPNSIEHIDTNGQGITISSEEGIKATKHDGTTLNNTLHIDLDGTAFFKGEVIADSGSFTGSITAGEGNIGGFHIGESSLWSGHEQIDHTDVNVVIDSNTPKITLGDTALSISTTENTGVYMDGNGSFRVGTATDGDNYLYFDSDNDNLTIKSEEFDLSSGKLSIVGDSEFSYIKLGDTENKTSNLQGIYITNDGEINIVLDEHNYIRNTDGSINIRGNQNSSIGFGTTAYNIGNGVWLSGDSTDNFRVGKVDDVRLQWTGSNLEIYDKDNNVIFSATDVESLLGGWKLDENSISNIDEYGRGIIISSTEGIKAQTSDNEEEIDNVKFHLDNKGNAYFNGHIEASSGSFSGKLNSNEGKIADWIINNNSISKRGITLNSEDSFISVEDLAGITNKNEDGYIRLEYVRGGNYVEHNGIKYLKLTGETRRVMSLLVPSETYIWDNIPDKSILPTYSELTGDDWSHVNEVDEKRGFTFPPDGYWTSFQHLNGNIAIVASNGMLFQLSATTPDVGIREAITLSENLYVASGGGTELDPYILKDELILGISDESAVFWAGSSFDNRNNTWGTANAPNFKVTREGNLYAQDGVFDGKITTEEGLIGGWTIDADSLNNIVSDTGIIISSSEGIKCLQDDNIKFHIDEQGNATFAGTLDSAIGSFSGRIEANEGYFGNEIDGVEVSADGLEVIGNGKIIAGSCEITENGIMLNEGSIALGDNFSVSIDGDLIASGVDISGTITSNQGNIGGWTIDAEEIKSTNITLNSLNEKIYIGEGIINNENTPFYVDGFGNFSLGDKLNWENNVLLIEGNIISDSGEIGGWTINTNALYKDEITEGAGIATDGDTRFWAGTNKQYKELDPWDVNGSKFKVTKDGQLYAQNAFISGTGQDSTGIGVNVISSGLHSVAIGTNANSGGRNSVAIGRNTEATGLDTMAIGIGSLSKNNFSTAVGHGCKCILQDAVGSLGDANYRPGTVLSQAQTAMGWGALADGNFALALGNNCKSQGYATIALGVAVEVAYHGMSSTGAIGIGFNTRAKSNGTISIGHEAGYTESLHIWQLPNDTETVSIGRYANNNISTSYNNSVAVGSRTKTKSPHSIALGFEATVNTNCENSVAIGRGAIATTSNQIVLGKSTDPPDVYIPGTLEVATHGAGVIVTSPDGSITKRIGIDNNGEIVVTDV